MFVESGFGVLSNSGRNEKFSDYQRKVVVLNFLKEISWCYYLLNRIDWSIYSIILDVWVWTNTIICGYYLISHNRSIIIAFINSKNLSVRIDSVNSSLYQAKQFFDFIKQSRATRHPSQLNGRNYSVRHILCRRTPPPPKLNLRLISFGVINFCGSRPVPRLVDSGTTV